MMMAWISEATCSVRRRRRHRVTVQPSSTHAYQSRCRNRAGSARIDAARIRTVTPLHLTLAINYPRIRPPADIIAFVQQACPRWFFASPCAAKRDRIRHRGQSLFAEISCEEYLARQ